MAVANGSAEKVKLLLSYGARSTGRDAAGNTLLHVAARKGHYAVVSVLLDSVPRDATNDAGQTALDLATSCAVKETLFPEYLAVLKAVDNKDEGADAKLLDVLETPGMHINCQVCCLGVAMGWLVGSLCQ